jgi:hypothetical protein
VPVDFTALLIALALWIGGTAFAYLKIRAAMLARHNAAIEGPLPAVRPLFWTMCTSILIAAFAMFVMWLYDGH